MRYFLIYVLVAFGCIMIWYLSWVHEPKLGSNWFIPSWLAEWTDSGDNSTLRTGVPFVFLGILVGVWLTASGKSWHRWLISWLLLILVVVIAELGQLFLPLRSFHWLDIAWGAAGAALGLSIVRILMGIGMLLKRTKQP